MKKVIIFLILILFVAGCSTNVSKKESERIKNIETKFSSDFKYFDISIDDFKDKIKYELSKYDIKINDEEKINDDVRLDRTNGDSIYIKSSENSKTESIRYYQENLTNTGENDVKNFIKIIGSLFIENIDLDNFQQELEKNVFVDEKLNDENSDDYLSCNEKNSYVYEHIKICISNYIEDSGFRLFELSVTPLKTNDENLKDIKERREKLEQIFKEDRENRNQTTKNENNVSQETKSPSNDSTATYGYEKIYNDYSSRLKNECPSLSIMECAEISNEGITKMAEYMYSASGTDGQYTTYEKWSGKLMDVYMQEAR